VLINMATTVFIKILDECICVFCLPNKAFSQFLYPVKLIASY
jgi:hypothetical protein